MADSVKVDPKLSDANLANMWRCVYCNGAMINAAKIVSVAITGESISVNVDTGETFTSTLKYPQATRAALREWLTAQPYKCDVDVNDIAAGEVLSVFIVGHMYGDMGTEDLLDEEDWNSFYIESFDAAYNRFVEQQVDALKRENYDGDLDEAQKSIADETCIEAYRLWDKYR